MTKTEKQRQFCLSCHDNYYNHSGNSTTGECWGLKSAKIVRRVRVGTWEPPPYYREPEKALSCHHESGYSWLDPKDQRVRKPKKQTA